MMVAIAMTCLAVGGIAQSAAAETAAPAATAPGGPSVAILAGKLTLRLPMDFVDQRPADTAGQDTGVAVQLFANREHSQVVGISTVRTVEGDANDTGDRAFNKMAQGAMSGLKTQFKAVKKTAQSTVTAGGHKFLRIDSEQEMRNSAIIGTLLITPYRDNVITVQVLSPAETAAEHNALVKTILDSVAFH